MSVRGWAVNLLAVLDPRGQSCEQCGRSYRWVDPMPALEYAPERTAQPVCAECFERLSRETLRRHFLSWARDAPDDALPGSHFEAADRFEFDVVVEKRGLPAWRSKEDYFR